MEPHGIARVSWLEWLQLPPSVRAYLEATNQTPMQVGGRYVDMSSRVTKSTAILGSPATNAETAIATTPVIDATINYSVAIVFAELAYTIGTSGTACTVQLRRGSGTAGASQYTTGAQTGGHNTATQLVADDVMCIDGTPATQYTVTLQVTGGAATSTVSATQIVAIYL